MGKGHPRAVLANPRLDLPLMHSWELDRVEPREGRLTHVMWCRWCRRLEELQRRSELALDDAVEELRLAFQSHCASTHGPNCPKVG